MNRIQHLCSGSLRLAALLTLAAASMGPAPASAQLAAPLSVEVLAVSGDPAPDGNGTISIFRAPVLSDAGRMAFNGSIQVPGMSGFDGGLFLLENTGSIVQIARSGDPAPRGGGELFGGGHDPFINEAGQMLGVPTLLPFAEQAVIRADGVNPVEWIAIEGDAAPVGIGTFSGFGGETFNDAGEIAFVATIDLPGVPGVANENALYRADPGGSLVTIARVGDVPPDGNGSISHLAQPRINAAGHIAFTADLIGTSGGTSDARGAYLADGAGNLVKLVRDGDPAPDGNGVFHLVGAYAINDAGQVIVGGLLTGTAAGFDDDNGLFLADSDGSVLQLVREGDPAPDGNGFFAGIGPRALNDAGQVLFDASFTGTSNGAFDDSGLFLMDAVPGGTITQVLREGDPMPGGGAFSRFEFPDQGPALNNAGQVAILAVIRNAGFDNRAMYFWDPVDGIEKIARKGEPLLCSRIDSFRWLGDFGLGDERTGLNELGDVAVGFRLDDGGEGILRWPGEFALRVSITAPASGAVVASDAVVVEGLASDDCGVTQVVVNGVAAELTPSGNPDDPLEVVFTATVPLVPGNNLITATARNTGFRELTASVEVDSQIPSGDDPPSLIITSPPAGTIVADDAVVVEGLASDDGQVVAVVVNGVAAALAPSGNPDDPNEVSFTATVPLVPGNNLIVAVAADDGGNENEASVAVESAPPRAPCDVNGDFVVDISDIQSIFAARGSTATGPDDPRDVNGDGLITINDGRLCVLRCSNPGCAP